MFYQHLSKTELIAFADGETSLARISAVEAHLRSCDRCSEALAQARASLQPLASLRPRPAPASIRTRAAAALSEATLKMTCVEALPLLHAEVDRRLSSLAAVPLSLHLKSCEQSRKELASLKQAAKLVQTLPVVAPPSVVFDRVRAAYQQVHRRTVRPVIWRPAYAGVVAALVLGVITAFQLPNKLPSVAPGTVVAEKPSALTSPPAPVAASSDVAQLEQESAAALPTVAQERIAPAATTIVAVDRRTHLRSAAPVIRLAVLNTSSGPAPEPGERATVASAPLPSALQALRTVAESTARQSEVRRSLEIAGERYATLNSEAAYASLPSSSARINGGISPAAAKGDGSGTDTNVAPSHSSLEGARLEGLPVA
jgi:anti-sigma factor RsiW